MKRKGALVWAGAVASFVLFVVWLVYSTVNETPPYAFMRGARQVGYWTDRGSSSVVRYYELDRDYAPAVVEARSELTGTRGWTEDAWIGVSFDRKDTIVSLWPMDTDSTRTLVVIGVPSNGLEGTIGRVYRRVPSWLEP